MTRLVMGRRAADGAVMMMAFTRPNSRLVPGHRPFHMTHGRSQVGQFPLPVFCSQSSTVTQHRTRSPRSSSRAHACVYSTSSKLSPKEVSRNTDVSPELYPTPDKRDSHSERGRGVAASTADYHPPQQGFLSYLPAAWVPYAELARLDKPTGALYLFFPCLFSTLAVSIYIHASPTAMLSTIGLFGTGALIMRGAGCTVNDLWDRNLDPHVARTRLRPLARRAVSPQAALIFTGAQCLAGLGILLQFPQPECLLWGAPSLILVALYPLAKRVTHYPQFVLGLTFSWGALMGFPAFGVDLTLDMLAAQAATCLYLSCVSWTVLYDMIYAHMDIKDDRAAGIKSIALRHEKNTKQVLTGLAVVQVGLLASTGTLLNLGPAFFIGSCGGSLATLLLMISKVRLDDPRNCWWWFRYGAWMTGGAITSGLLGSYLVHPINPPQPGEIILGSSI